MLDHLPELVVKAVGRVRRIWDADRPDCRPCNGGGFPRSESRPNPRNYIAQPLVALSRVPSYDATLKNVGGRHVDLRPYCLL